MASSSKPFPSAWFGAFAALTVAGLVAMAEIDRIVSGAVVGGASYSTAAIYGPLKSPGSVQHVFAGWATATCTGGTELQAWLAWNLGFDVLFIVGYAVMALIVVRQWGVPIGGLVAVLVAADLAEDALAGVAIIWLPESPHCSPTYGAHPALFWSMFFATTLKWLAALALILVVGFWLWDQRLSVRPSLRDVLTALKKQRFGLILVGALAVLVLLPSGGVFDQFPDLARVWLLSDDKSVGILHFVVATLTVVLLAALLRYLSSVRTARAVDETARAEEAARAEETARAVDETTTDIMGSAPAAVPQAVPSSSPGTGASATRPSGSAISRWLMKGWNALANPEQDDTGHRDLSRWWLWLVVACSLLLVALLLQWRRWATITWTTVFVAAGILVAVVLATFATGALPLRGRKRNARIETVASTWQTGRILAWAVPSIFALGVMRAYVPAVVLSYGLGRSIPAMVGGLVGGCVIWLFALRANRTEFKAIVYTNGKTNEPWLHPQRRGNPVDGRPWGSLAVLAAASAVLAIPMLAWPVHLSRFLGVMGSIAVGLATLTAVFTTLALVAQLFSPPRFFRVLALTTTPVISIVVVIALVASMFNRTPTVHRVRSPDAAGKVETQKRIADAQTWWKSSSATQSIDEWLQRADGMDSCAIPTGQKRGSREVRVQPMILVATEGGGIWSATWTVDVLSELETSETSCARNAVFAASGVSGGSVGLAAMATSADPKKAIAQMGGENALAAASDGLTTHDLLAGSLGVNIHAADGPTGAAGPDRAALIEQAWERSDPGLAQPFPLLPYDPGKEQQDVSQAQVPWHTLFNSTSALTGCRVVISDIDLRPQQGGKSEDPNCYRNNPASPASDNKELLTADPIAGTYNLFAAQPCLIGMHVSTAALLSGRFPYVTPSGVIDKCGSQSLGDQLIDGGYSEDTGIATIDSLLTQIMPAVRRHNQDQIDGTGAVTLVVPMVVFIQKSARAPIRPYAQAPGAAREPLIPLTRGIGGSDVLSTDDTLLGDADNLTNDWIGSSSDATGLLRAGVEKVFPHRTMIVAPERQPEIAAPLGWTMSNASRDALDTSLNHYLSCQNAQNFRCVGSTDFDNVLMRLHVTLPPASS